MNEEILKSLAKLEQNLQKIDSAKTMVEKTVHAYNDVSLDIKSYSDSLSETSKNIRDLIAELKANKEHISTQISEELQSILSKFELSVADFTKTAEGLQSVFKSQSNDLISGLSGSLADSTSNMETSTKEIADTFKNNTEDSLYKLKSLVEKFNEDVNAFNDSIDKRFEIIHKEHQEQQKLQIALFIVLSFISLLNLILLLLR